MQACQLTQKNVNGVYRIADTGKVVALKGFHMDGSKVFLHYGDHPVQTIPVERDTYLDVIA